MKKFIPILASALLALIFAGCGGNFKAGTYSGGAPGIHGDDVVVEVTVDKKSIKEIKIIENHETPGVSDVAFERIPKAIIEGQTLNVDSVSGATYSSKAIIGAVTKALEAAGGVITSYSIHYTKLYEGLLAGNRGGYGSEESEIVRHLQVVGGNLADSTVGGRGSDAIILIHGSGKIAEQKASGGFTDLGTDGIAGRAHGRHGGATHNGERKPCENEKSSDAFH